MSAPEALDILVALDAQGGPPTEFRIFAKGELKTRKGPHLFDEVAATNVMRHVTEFGAEYPLDYGHGMLGHSAADPAELHKAAGWFRPELRAGELWAAGVTWTPLATKKIREREYRYVSPMFMAVPVTSEDGTSTGTRRIEELLNVALTNVPASHGLAPLVLATDMTGASPEKERQMTVALLATLAATMGCDASASESDIVGRVTEQRDALAELRRVTGKDKPKEAVGVALAWSADLAATKAALATLSVAAKQTSVERKVAEKIDAFLLIPAQREWAVKLGMQDEAMLDGFLSTLTTPVVLGGAAAQPRGAPVRQPTLGRGNVIVPPAAELRLLGITEADFVKTQQKMIDEGLLE